MGINKTDSGSSADGSDLSGEQSLDIEVSLPQAGPGSSIQFPADATDPEEAVAASERMSDVQPIIMGIRYFVLAISLPMWALLGFYIWVPLLIRSILGLSLNIATAALTRKSTKTAEKRLHHSIGFYNEGFRRVFTAILAPLTPTEDDDDVHFFGEAADGSMVTPSLGALLKELLIATGVWIVLLSPAWIQLALAIAGKSDS